MCEDGKCLNHEAITLTGVRDLFVVLVSKDEANVVLQGHFFVKCGHFMI